MYGFIYITTNLLNGKKYIGMCKYSHEKNYLGSGKLLKEAIKKYGEKNFKREVLEVCETFESMCQSEEKWIEKYDAVNNKNFYNLVEGGFGGSSEYLKKYWSEFTREERKYCRKWYKRDLSGVNNPMYGKKHTEETKKLIGSKSINRNWRKPNHKGEKNPRAKSVLVEMDGTIKKYSCLKYFAQECQNIPYSTLKYIARKEIFSKKYNLKISYA